LAAGLVASNATAPPAITPEAPRPVAKTSVARGETVVGGTVQAVTPGQPTAVTPMKPSAPAQRPKPVKQPPTRKILAGDLICGECGEGNPPARNFCSRCGTTLKEAKVAKRKWWQIFVPKRRQKTLEAGSRPWKASDGSTKQRRKGGALAKIYLKLRPIVAVVILLAGLLIGFSPNLRERFTNKVADVKDSAMSRIQPTYSPLAPIGITVTSQFPENPGENLIDTNPQSFWLAPGNDPEPTIVVTFDEPFDLAKIKLWNGSAVGFKDNERIQTLHFVFDTGQSFDLTVDDLPDEKLYDIKNGNDVREVEIHVTETYSSLASDTLGVSEIEFLFKK
jgi:hypothetical protein